MKRVVIIISFLFIFNQSVIAKDISIICTKDKCQSEFKEPIFSEKNAYPGYQVQYDLNVKNLRDDDCELSFFLIALDDQIPSLSKKIQLSIKHYNNIWYSNNLYDLFLANVKNERQYLGQVNKKSQEKYQLNLLFDQDAGNNYQASSMKFNIDFDFVCNNPSNNTINKNDNGRCSYTVPKAPSDLEVISDDQFQTYTLKWKNSVSVYTNYLIGYGYEPNNYLYTKILNANNNFYTFSDLEKKSQYCFYIKTINNCAVSQETIEKCTGNFQQNILGVSTTNPSINKKNNNNKTVNKIIIKLATSIEIHRLSFLKPISNWLLKLIHTNIYII